VTEIVLFDNEEGISELELARSYMFIEVADILDELRLATFRSQMEGTWKE
jgi:hypothetical protein